MGRSERAVGPLGKRFLAKVATALREMPEDWGAYRVIEHGSDKLRVSGGGDMQCGICVNTGQEHIERPVNLTTCKHG